MEQKKLNEKLKLHKMWLDNEKDGERANLSYADLRYTNLRYDNLSSADLSYTDLSCTDLRYTNLCSADLSDANLSYADLPNFQICPEEGTFVGWKTAITQSKPRTVLIKLKITGKRTSSLIGRVCRTSAAEVLEIRNVATDELIQHSSAFSIANPAFRYKLNHTVTEPKYNSDIRIECIEGIHFFITKREALERV